MAMTGFICHDDYFDRLARLSNEEVGNLFRQLMLYHAGRFEEMSDFVGSEGVAFDFIANDINRMEEKQSKASETNRENGLKGGRPKKQNEPAETEENRNKPTETEQKPTKGYKDKDKYKDKDIKETLLTECKEKETRFIPPTVEEVTEYCKERNNKVDAQTFVDFYTAKGWKIGKNQIKDWKACVRTWERNNRENVLPTVKRVVAQQYEQRDYSSEQDEAMKRMLSLGDTG